MIVIILAVVLPAAIWIISWYAYFFRKWPFHLLAAVAGLGLGVYFIVFLFTQNLWWLFADLIMLITILVPLLREAKKEAEFIESLYEEEQE